jgi:hypothetical protein
VPRKHVERIVVGEGQEERALRLGAVVAVRGAASA